MAIKLLHTSDLHLDAPFLFLGEKGHAHRQELLSALDRIVRIAIEEKADLFLIAGDLFNSNNPSYTTIDLVVDTFKKLEQVGIPICLIPGSHDCYDAHSVYRLYNFQDALSNLTIFTDKLKKKTFEDLDLTVYGRAVLGRGEPESFLQNLVPVTKTKFHVALIHGFLDSLADGTKEKDIFYADEIKNSNMSYIALGAHHSFTNCSQDSVKAFYCGSPEMLDFRQKDAGYISLVTIYPSGQVKVEQKKVGGSHYEIKEIAVDTITNVNQIIDAIRNKANLQCFLEVQLTGPCSFDLLIDPNAIEQELEPHFLRLRVIDQTYPQLEEIPVGKLPENTVIGQFVSMMRDELDKSAGEERELNEKALRLGVGLLRGKKVYNDY